MEITKSEQNFLNEQRLEDLWDINKRSNIHVMWVS